MTEKHFPITGGCLCGAVRYESANPPLDGGYCHCSKCRKAYGGLFGVLLILPASGFRFTKGQPKYYRSSDWTRRGFCSTCGSSLDFLYDGDPNPSVVIGSLDNPNDWSLAQAGWCGHVFVDDKVSWYEITDGMPQHAQSAGYADAAKKRT